MKKISLSNAINMIVVSACVVLLVMIVSTPTEVKDGDTITVLCTIGQIDPNGSHSVDFYPTGAFAVTKIVRGEKVFRTISQEGKNVRCCFERYKISPQEFSKLLSVKGKSIELVGYVTHVKRVSGGGQKYTILSISVNSFSD